MKIVMIRHGQTTGNLKGQYIGSRDETLCAEGIKAVQKCQYERPQKLFCSPMKRCIQTAEILFPGMEYQVCRELRECDFGIWEGKSYQELSENQDYQHWIDSNGTLPFPQGESTQIFKERCCRAFEKLISDCVQTEYLGLVIHGGTIMAILERYAVPRKTFYEYQIKNAEALLMQLDVQKMQITGVEKV